MVTVEVSVVVGIITGVSVPLAVSARVGAGKDCIGVPARIVGDIVRAAVAFGGDCLAVRILVGDMFNVAGGGSRIEKEVAGTVKLSAILTAGRP